MNQGPLRDRVTDEKTLLEGRAYDLVELTIQNPAGESRSKGVIRHRGAAVVLPLLEQPGRAPKIVFVENERQTLGRRLLELPAGGVDPGEAPDEAAARELREETGFEAASLEPLLAFYTTPGLTDERMHAFVATGLHRVGQSLEPDEALEVRIHTASDVADLLDRGDITDGKTIATLLYAVRKRWIEL